MMATTAAQSSYDDDDDDGDDDDDDDDDDDCICIASVAFILKFPIVLIISSIVEVSTITIAGLWSY